MAVLELQSFSTTATLAQLGGTIVEGATIASGAGRLGGNCLNAANNNDYWQKGSVFANTQTVCVGFAFSYNAVPQADTFLFSFTDAGTRQVEIGISPAGQLFVARGNGNVLARSSVILYLATFYYIELKAKIDNSTGTYELRLNGETILSATSQDTQQSANAYANGYNVGNCYGNSATSLGTARWHDFYIAEDFLGDIRVSAILPNGNGNTSQLVGQDGNSTDNYLLVDDPGSSAPDDDTTYVASATVGDKDTYGYANLPVAGDVHGLKVKIRSRKTDASAKSACNVIRSGGSDFDGTSFALTTTYAYYDQVYATNPSTAAAWTDETEVDGAEFGVKVSA